jgi:hypothetical protein
MLAADIIKAFYLMDCVYQNKIILVKFAFQDLQLHLYLTGKHVSLAVKATTKQIMELTNVPHVMLVGLL